MALQIFGERGSGRRSTLLPLVAARKRSPQRVGSRKSSTVPETRKRKMSMVTISMLIVVSTFGLTNVIDNLVELGLAAIPSWLVVSAVYFLPLAMILAEFASDTREARGGIYSYMERGLGPTWAFVGTCSYFVANLVCSRRSAAPRSEPPSR